MKLKCPECGKSGPYLVIISCGARVGDDGQILETFTDDGNLFDGYLPTSSKDIKIECEVCGLVHIGNIDGFEVEGEEK